MVDTTAGPRGDAANAVLGLRMSLTLPPAPFFLSQLLPVRVALHNDSSGSVTYHGYPDPVPGKSALLVTISGGQPPLFTLPWYPPFSGPRPPDGRLDAGATLDMELLMPLTASGMVTLIARVRLDHVTHEAGVATATEVQPFPDGWPSVVISVAPQVPADRMLQLQRRGPQVLVTAPRRTSPQLLYQDLLTCTDPSAPGHRLLRGTADWRPLPGDGLWEPACPDAGQQKRWQVMVSAPGFAITSAAWPS
jgi:hypothetical protein